ncbi:MAG: hypothetical protein JST12_13145 [Armatimonadetes bacterium]|nr:hypothetical protein [Armatimonadota bacterium]
MRQIEFANVIRTVFRAEHHAETDGQVAHCLGWTKGRMSQILNSPETLTVATIRQVVGRLRTPKFRENVIDAWCRASFGTTGLYGHADGSVRGFEAYELALSLNDDEDFRMAAAVVEAAIVANPDKETHESLLDLGFSLAIRLDALGTAMEYVSTIAENAIRRSLPHRKATAALFAVLIQIEAERLTYTECERLFEKVRVQILKAGLSEARESNFYVVTLEDLDWFLLTNYLKTANPGDRSELDTQLRVELESLKGSEETSRWFGALFRMAEIAWFFGERDEASGYLELARSQSDGVSVTMRMQARILKGKIAAETSPERALRYLNRAIATCERKELYTLKREAERVKVRLLAEAMP